MIVRFPDAYPSLVFIAEANMIQCLGSELGWSEPGPERLSEWQIVSEVRV